MAVTSGFFNALNHDRLYDALQMSSLFDGIIKDGIFSTLGNALVVQATGTGMVIKVRSGRAWFNHCWVNNDSDYLLEVSQAEVVLKRIDAVVIEVNHSTSVRDGYIKIVKGTPATNPARPSMIHNTEVNQYALAYITINAGTTTITSSMITNNRGTSATPFVTGLLQQMSIESLLTQWEAEFDEHFSNWEDTQESEFNTWFAQKVSEYNTWYTTRVSIYNNWYDSMVAEGNQDLADFDEWFDEMKGQLSTDAAGHLQAEIDDLRDNAISGSTIKVYSDNSNLAHRTVTITDGTNTKTGTFDENIECTFNNVTFGGTITIQTTDGVTSMSRKEYLPYIGIYEFYISDTKTQINVTSNSKLANSILDIIEIGSSSSKVIGKLLLNSSGAGSYIVQKRVNHRLVGVATDGTVYKGTATITSSTTTVSVAMRPDIYYTASKMLNTSSSSNVLTFNDSNIHADSEVEVQYYDTFFDPSDPEYTFRYSDPKYNLLTIKEGVCKVTFTPLAAWVYGTAIAVRLKIVNNT